MNLIDCDDEDDIGSLYEESIDTKQLMIEIPDIHKNDLIKETEISFCEDDVISILQLNMQQCKYLKKVWYRITDLVSLQKYILTQLSAKQCIRLEVYVLTFNQVCEKFAAAKCD
jgi:hypothetical protein